MKGQDIVKLFEFVVQEVDRLKILRQADWKQAMAEVGLHRGLPVNYERLCRDYYECGKIAARQLYQMAATKLETTPSLKGRVKVETFLKPIEVELAQRVVAQRTKIDDTVAKIVLREAEARARATLEDRTYFFPVYTISPEEIQKYAFGPATFIRTEGFFGENAAELKRSEDVVAMSLEKTEGVEDDGNRKHISKLFDFAREHYGAYRWIAYVEIKGAEPDIGWEKAREILDYSLGLLRLSIHSRERQFIGVIEENPTPRSASFMSLKSTNDFDVWYTSNYGEPHVTASFLEDYRRKAPQLVNLEAIIVKAQQWNQLDPIEDRLLTALFWFNEAWKETNVLPKIVKFSTCIESLFSTTGDHEAISEKSAERLAWLAFPGESDWQDRSETYRTMKSVYRARSKAVHGDSAVKDLNLPLLARQAEEQSALGIFAFSQLPPLFLEKKDKEKLLNEFFVRLKLEGLARAQQLLVEA